MENNPTKEKLLAEIGRLKKELKKKKKYGLVWEDKPEEVVEMCKEKLPVLKEVKGKEIITDKNKPVNLLIEGDNYHALSVLNYTHKGKIDVIYIDPPYNTGNKDFKYNDRFVDREDSFRHSKWISFMEKRLKLAKNLLKNTGVIFISINDNEFAQLKLLLDKIFKEDNFIGEFIWKNKLGGGNDSKVLVTEHEYILCYSKKSNLIKKFTEPNVDNGKYLYQDEYIKTRGKFALEALYRSSIQYSDSLFYAIKTPDGKLIWPNESDKESKKHIWRWSKSTFERKLKEGRAEFKKTKNGWRVFSKQYFLEDDDGDPRVLSARSIIDFIGNRQGTELLKKIFNNEKIFNNPKPIELIKYLLEIYQDKKSIILDFMAGSGTTGHAVLELNKEDGGNRKFILCTNNELNGLEKELREKGMKESEIQEHGICRRVCYPRIEKVINGYENSKGEKVEGLGGNLKYYKTEFVDYKNPNDKNKIKLTKEAVEMLCVKEETFELVVDKKDFKIFKNHNHYTGIIFDQLAIKDFKKAIQNIKSKFSVYVFSLGDDSFDEEFEDIKSKVKLSPIPEAILKVYRRIFK